MKRSLIIAFFFLISLNLFAQKEATWWYFGSRAGMSFTGTGGAPVVQTNGQMNNFEGVASISNNKGGLLFYTDGEQVYNKKHAIMSKGGTGGAGDPRLNGHNSSTQSAVIVQQPVRSNQYWIFTVDENWGNRGFCFSIVDTALNGGDGQVIQKNQPIIGPTLTTGNSSYPYQVKGVAPEKVAAVKHANKVDTWIVNHTGGDNNFYVWLLNARGLNTPVVSTIGPTWTNTGSGGMGYSKGYMKFTPDGTKLICAIAGQQSIGFGGYNTNTGRIEIYDFDNLTGKLSNPQILNSSNINTTTVGNVSSVYGIEVSPNGRYLYVSFYIPKWSVTNSYGNDGIWQIDLLAGDATAMGASCQKVVNDFGSPYAAGGMQLGPDGKIWIARASISNQAPYLSCISKPNCKGTACTFVNNAISLSPRSSQMGVPTFINSFFNKAEFDWGSNAANLCENALTKLYITDSSGVDSAHWNFGDPSTGTKNIAKGFSVYHKFSSPKTYSVFVELFRKVTSADCYADTARKKLTIFPNPKFTLGNDTVICQGQEAVKVVNITNATYVWNDNSTVPAYIANTKGWHWLDAKVGGCTARDSFYVDVIQFPKFKLGKDTLFCQYDSVKLTAANGQRYLWKMGDTTASVYAKKSDTIWARAENKPGCYTYDTIVVKTRAIPTLNLGKDTLLCKGDTVKLDAKTSTSKLYLWSDMSTADTLLVTTAGIYWAQVKDTMCFSKRDSIDVAFQTKASFSLGKDTSFCVGGSWLLNAALSGAKTWKWKDNSTKSTYLANTAGTQWVEVSNGTCKFYDTIDLKTYSIPPFSLGRDTILCEGVTFNAISTVLPNVEYTWMGSVVNYSYPITTTGKYYVDLRDLPKKVCKSTDTIKVTFNKPLKIDLGRDTILCVGQTVDLTIANYAVSTFKWEWDGNTTLKTRKNITPTGGKHKITAFDGVCNTSDSINVTYRPELFIPELGMDSTFCDNYTKTMDIADINATKYEWKNPAGTVLATTNQYTATSPGGMYIGIISDGFCYKRDSVTYSYKVTPKIDLGPDIQVCNGISPTLDASAAAAETYKWNTGAITPTLLAPNQPKTQYIVTAANGNCKDTNSIWVYFSIPPVLNLGFADSVFCDAPILNYDFKFYADNTTFTWENGSNLPNRKITSPGIYWVKAENACGKDSVGMNVKIDELGCQMYFPGIFSPNGDGVNDIWKPQGQVIEWVELVIYDRWGEIIHKGDPSKGWDGSLQGKNVMVQDGVYPMTIAYRQSTGGYPRLYVKNLVLTVVK